MPICAGDGFALLKPITTGGLREHSRNGRLRTESRNSGLHPVGDWANITQTRRYIELSPCHVCAMVRQTVLQLEQGMVG